MVYKKAILIWILLQASLTMAAHPFHQFQAQASPNHAASVTAVSTLTLLPSQTPLPNLSPVAGARQWLEALNTQDDNRLQNLTCQAQRENLKKNSGWVLAFPVLGKIRADLIPQMQGLVDGLPVEVIRQNAEQARLRVYGNLPVIGPGLMGLYEVDERWWMVYEDGGWRWCGATPGEATPTLTPTITPTVLPITRPDLARNSSSLSVWKILSVLAAILGAVARIYTAIQRKKDKTL
jgi:hypothetical protein